MPTAALRFCSVVGCSARVPHGRCDAHRTPQARVRQPIHGSMRWRRLSRDFLRDHPLCVGYPKDTHTRCPTLAEVTDHVHPVRTHPHLQWDTDNLQPLCRDCHARKSATEGEWLGR